jgi:hypothetical protein
VQREFAYEIARGKLLIVLRAAGLFADLDRAFGGNEVGMRARFEEATSRTVPAISEQRALRSFAQERLRESTRERLFPDACGPREEIAVRESRAIERCEVCERSARADDVERAFDGDYHTGTFDVTKRGVP